MQTVEHGRCTGFEQSGGVDRAFECWGAWRGALPGGARGPGHGPGFVQGHLVLGALLCWNVRTEVGMDLSRAVPSSTRKKERGWGRLGPSALFLFLFLYSIYFSRYE